MKKDLNVGLKIEKLAANKTNTSYDLFLMFAWVSFTRAG